MIALPLHIGPGFRSAFQWRAGTMGEILGAGVQLARAAMAAGQHMQTCTRRDCAAPARWRGVLRVWAAGTSPDGQTRVGRPLVTIAFTEVCHGHSDQTLRDHVASDAFWNMLSLACEASLLAPLDRDSLELEMEALR